MQIRRWGLARLRQEIAFAAAFDLQEPNAIEWLRILMNENNRRDRAQRGLDAYENSMVPLDHD